MDKLLPRCCRPETLNESPSEKEGKFQRRVEPRQLLPPSMKVPPKRKGNRNRGRLTSASCTTLNESPSEKEGK